MSNIIRQPCTCGAGNFYIDGIWVAHNGVTLEDFKRMKEMFPESPPYTFRCQHDTPIMEEPPIDIKQLRDNAYKVLAKTSCEMTAADMSWDIRVANEISVLRAANAELVRERDEARHIARRLRTAFRHLSERATPASMSTVPGSWSTETMESWPVESAKGGG